MSRSPRSRSRKIPWPRPQKHRRTTRPLTKRRNAALLTALGLVVAGCSSEDPQQEAAREEVQRHVRTLTGYEVADVHCTDAAGVWFRDVETDQFTCAVRRLEGGCDWFAVLVDRDRRRATVRLAQRDAGCTLGF